MRVCLCECVCERESERDRERASERARARERERERERVPSRALTACMHSASRVMRMAECMDAERMVVPVGKGQGPPSLPSFLPLACGFDIESARCPARISASLEEALIKHGAVVNPTERVGRRPTRAKGHLICTCILFDTTRHDELFLGIAPSFESAGTRY